MRRDRRGGERATRPRSTGGGDPRRCAWAEAGDTVVIAGKGHETYQIVGARRAAVRRPRGRAPDLVEGQDLGAPMPPFTVQDIVRASQGRPGRRRPRRAHHRRVGRLARARRRRSVLRHPRQPSRRSRVPRRGGFARRRVPGGARRSTTTCRPTCRWSSSRTPRAPSACWPRVPPRAVLHPGRRGDRLERQDDRPRSSSRACWARAGTC